MKKLGYIFTGAGMLAVCSVLGKLLGAMYRIPLTNVLGGEGMGLYQMVFPLYTLLLTLSSGGLPVAISRLVAVKLASNDEKGATKVLWVSTAALSTVGLAGSILLAAANRFLARVQGNPAASPAYLGISPSVFFVAVLSCFRGYYQGRENMLPSAASQLVEQAGKLGAGLLLSRLLLPRGLSYAVFGALLGVSISEALATALMLAIHAFGAPKRKRNLVNIQKRKLLHGMATDAGFGAPDPAPPTSAERPTKPMTPIEPTDPTKPAVSAEMPIWGTKNANAHAKRPKKTTQNILTDCAIAPADHSDKAGRSATASKSNRHFHSSCNSDNTPARTAGTPENPSQTAAERSRRLRADRARRADERRRAKEAAKSGEAITRGSDSDFAGDMTAELGLATAGAGLQSSCKRNIRKNPATVLGILKEIAAVALPVTFGSLVLPVTQVVDSVLIVNVLTRLGTTAEAATAAYGLVNGTVMTLVNMPVVVIFAFSAALLPKIAKACSDRETVAREAGLSLKICSVLGLAAFLFIFVYAEPLVKLLYSRGLPAPQRALCARLLRLSAFTVFYVSIVQVCTAVLQGLDMSKKPAFALFVGALVKVGITAALLFVVGIYGAVVGSIACYAVTAVIDLVYVRRQVPLRLRPGKAYVPLLAAAAFLAVGTLLSRVLAFLPPIALMFASALPALAVYVAVILACRWFARGELRRIF